MWRSCDLRAMRCNGRSIRTAGPAISARQLAAAQKAQADMDHYQPAPPPVTVSNGITKAVDPLLSGARRASPPIKRR